MEKALVWSRENFSQFSSILNVHCVKLNVQSHTHTHTHTHKPTPKPCCGNVKNLLTAFTTLLTSLVLRSFQLRLMCKPSYSLFPPSVPIKKTLFVQSYKLSGKTRERGPKMSRGRQRRKLTASFNCVNISHPNLQVGHSVSQKPDIVLLT